MWKIVYTKRANKDKKKLKAAGLDEKAKSLVEIVRDGPFSKPPEFEPLKGNLSGSYSRRINYQHRFVYQVVAEPFEDKDGAYEGAVKVLSMWSRYERV